MKDEFISDIDGVLSVVNQNIDIMLKKQSISYLREKYKIKNSIGEFYLKKICTNKKGKGAVYTPYNITTYMIEECVSEKDILNNPFIKICDPACGTGNFLIPLYKILHKIYEENLDDINKSNNLNLKHMDIMSHIFNYNLYGYDVDENAIKVLKLDMFEQFEGLPINIFRKDFLMNEDEKYNIVIGNPPYVGHKSIDKSYSSILKEKFKEVFLDKGDLSYCFIKKSIDSLIEHGKLSFITSRYFLEAPSGKNLRRILKEECRLDCIVDYYGVRPFKGVGVDPLIISLRKDENKGERVKIIRPNINRGKIDKEFNNSLIEKNNSYREYTIHKKQLEDERWNLMNEKEVRILNKIEEKCSYLLGEICTSYQGIITGCDKAFVCTMEDVEHYKIEKELIKPWIKSSYILNGEINRKDNYIIYSDLIEKEEQFPNAIKYISIYREKLQKRRECLKGIRKWYHLQWGRKQEIFERKKIIFPYKSSGNRFVLDTECYFSADIYNLVINDEEEISYRQLLTILNSPVYEFYFKCIGKKLGEDLYEYYPNNLMKLKIPKIPPKNKMNQYEIQQYFQLTGNEINIIEKYTSVSK